MHPSSCGTGRARRLAVAVVTAAVLTALSGCPAPGARSAGDPRTAPAATAGADAGADGPRGRGPATPGTPAADQPLSTGPLRAVVGTVDLTAAAPGVFSQVEQAVAGPGGTVHVTLAPVGSSRAPRLATVRPSGTGFAVRGSVELTGVDDVWGLHLLADGAVVVTGTLRTAEGRRAGYGLAVVDPSSGRVRTTVVEPYAGKTLFAFGRSALAPDGRTLYLFLSTLSGGGARERLIALDAATGTVLADRDLAADVAAVSESPAGHELAGLVPLPDGGVTLVVDATPDARSSDRIPTLLSFDGTLQATGRPVPVTSRSERAQTHAVAAGGDGTTFLVVEVSAGGGWVMAVPPGGEAGPVLAQLDDSYDYALVVEPAQVWGLLPARAGARPVDLTTGELREPVDVGCPGQDVRGLFPGEHGAGAVMVGECNSPRTRTQMLWILGP
ncbi:MAG: hypothetical protein JWQ45_855 [Blastococcus sp.]|jgi:hypothetical protein|nr:hypothetical protein [Blastococcus sp.]